MEFLCYSWYIKNIDLGHNVKIFDPSVSNEEIQIIVDSIFDQMETNEFGIQRYALFFKPDTYNINVNVGFYISVIGLGRCHSTGADWTSNTTKSGIVINGLI